MKGLDVNITLKAGNAYLNIPVIPAELSYDDGSTTPITVSILQLGDVDFHNGVALDTLSWSCFFPARYDAGYCKSTKLLTPISYRNKLSVWKDKGTKIQVIIPSAGINKAMKIVSFKWVFKGFEGDLYYDIVLKEHKTIKPIQVSSNKLLKSNKRNAVSSNLAIEKGAKVKFNGGPVYTASNASKAATNKKNAMCKCTNTISGKHPYHLISESGDKVYGWVNASDCSKL